MTPLKQMLSESNGKVSIMRILVTAIVCCMVIPPTVYALRNNEPQVAMDFNSIILVLGALAGKGLQRVSEGGKPSTQPPTQKTP